MTSAFIQYLYIHFCWLEFLVISMFRQPQSWDHIPHFAGVSEFKSRPSCEVAGWLAIPKMISNVHILDLHIQTFFGFFCLFWFLFLNFLTVILLRSLTMYTHSPKRWKNITPCKIQFWNGRGGSLKLCLEIDFQAFHTYNWNQIWKYMVFSFNQRSRVSKAHNIHWPLL